MTHATPPPPRSASASPSTGRLTPAPAVAGLRPYRVPRSLSPIDLRLDGNEGPPPPEAIRHALCADDEMVRRYPDAAPLEQRLAARLGTAADRVIVTAGADDALDRLCRAMLVPGRRVLLHTPTFEMLERSARLAGVAESDVLRVPWDDGTFPGSAYAQEMTPAVSLAFVVTPNNPTGLVVDRATLLRLADRAQETGTLLVVDLAYVEFADADPTAALLECPNVVIVRTLSKAWGLAGMRVGYAATGPAWGQGAELMTWLRASGGPYAVSGASVTAALAVLPPDRDATPAHVARFVHTTRAQRARVEERLRALAMDPAASQANYAFARTGTPERALWIRDALAAVGIGIRAYPDKPALSSALRITAPESDRDTDRVRTALRAAATPEAILFDMDGVLADVSQSYRRAIIGTCASFGVDVDAHAITAAKGEGDANNDWILTRRLLARRGVEAALDEVTARFEALYQGDAHSPGLRDSERLIPDRATLVELARRLPQRVGIVTGRPRRDAQRFLDRFGLRDLFACVVSMEDAPAKPSPAPVQKALEALGVRTAWLIGDTPDDIIAARRASGQDQAVIPVGYLASYDMRSDAAGAADALLRAGAARILSRVDEILDMLHIAKGRS